jgi:hypothetical protein
VLGPDGIAHFTRAAAGRARSAPLLTDGEGEPWNPETWSEEVRAALGRHNEQASEDRRLPEGLGAYAFRHARISELLKVYNIDPLTVARQTGTSLQQIEKTYHKFIGSAMKEKLAAVREA